ncbi:GNAT family N-acetyltransferase [Marinicrinis lubricantis]|uniref:GNAT family N-acetyltransferase n=1 Tax=Marinicrinis lubricantis TaxID=2086470 RepID=A0ABW1IQY5_9BACL
MYKDENGWLAGHDRFRIVAVNEHDRVIGYGISWRAPWTAAGELNHLLVVDPDARNQQVGSTLYREMEQWAGEVGASKLNFEVDDDDNG